MRSPADGVLHRVDHERARAVVAAKREGDPLAAEQEASLDGTALPAELLVGARGELAQSAPACRRTRLPLPSRRICLARAKLSVIAFALAPGWTSRSYEQVVLEGALPAVVGDVVPG